MMYIWIHQLSLHIVHLSRHLLEECVLPTWECLLKLLYAVKVGKINFGSCLEGKVWVSARAYCIDVW